MYLGRAFQTGDRLFPSERNSTWPPLWRLSYLIQCRIRNLARAYGSEASACKARINVKDLAGHRENRRDWLQREFTARKSGGIVATAVPPPALRISDLALVRFASPELNTGAKGLLFKAFAYDVANQSLSPLDRFINFDSLESAPFEWLFCNNTFLHSILYTSYAINDFAFPGWDGKPGRNTLFIYTKLYRFCKKNFVITTYTKTSLS